MGIVHLNWDWESKPNIKHIFYYILVRMGYKLNYSIRKWIHFYIYRTHICSTKVKRAVICSALP